MKIRTVLMSAAVAAVLAASGTANAQLLGGGANGGLGGSITGGLGNVGATAGGTLNGSLRGSTDALGRTRELGSRAAGRVKDTAESARGQVESAAAASANAAGEAGSSVDVATEDVERDAKAPEDKPHKAKGQAKNAPAKADRAPVEKPQPKAHADGKANGNSGLSAFSDEPSAAGQGNAGVEMNASVEK
jgi:hypothetical protein